jgi:hypothetical protein
MNVVKRSESGSETCISRPSQSLRVLSRWSVHFKSKYLLIMVAFNTFILATATLLASVTAAPTFGPVERDTELVEREVTDLVKRQQRFATQYWANEQAKLTWKSGNAGLYSLNWTNPTNGNFVVGKGYMGQGM